MAVILFKGNLLVDRYQRGEIKTKAELNVVAEIIATWRSCLMDISWFMRCLNESIAAWLTKKVTARGVSGRSYTSMCSRYSNILFIGNCFKSQALLDETALLTCMMYVDLNPIRAGINITLEGSDFTSIQDRLFEFSQQGKNNKTKSKANTIQIRIKQIVNCFALKVTKHW